MLVPMLMPMLRYQCRDFQMAVIKRNKQVFQKKNVKYVLKIFYREKVTYSKLIQRNQVYFSSSNVSTDTTGLDVEGKVYILFQNCYQIEPNKITCYKIKIS